MVQEPGGETVLSGPVMAQARHGVLSRIHDLGAPLLPGRRPSPEEASRKRSAADAAQD